MSQLTRRLMAAERRARMSAGECPEHQPTMTPIAIDYRNGLAPFLPDPEARAAYRAELEAQRAEPPCDRCGWRPFVVEVHAADNWGQHDPPADR